MRRGTRIGLAAFAITGILMLALCGFAAVDLSADRYMQGQFVPAFEVSDLDGGGISISLFGARGEFPLEQVDAVKDLICRYRALLPGSVRAAAGLTAQGYAVLSDSLEAARPPEEPW